MTWRHWGSFAIAAALIASTLITAAVTASPPARPGLVTTAGWRASNDTPGPAPRGPVAEAAWLSAGSVPGKGTRWEDMVRWALVDLHQLSRPNGAVAAGAASSWNYDWPRDTAFVAVALARTGHRVEAVKALEFLQQRQLVDGDFEARYLLVGTGTPDGRARQSDGAGWLLWALNQIGAAGDVSRSAGLRALLDHATRFVHAETADGRRLPPASPDYWEVGVRRTSLGTVAPMLAGLEASQEMYAALGEPAVSQRSGAAAARLRKLVAERFGGGYERFGSRAFRGGGGVDAAVTFLMPPFSDSASAQVVDSWLRYQSDAARPAGGLAPGAQWKQDGISWTPETALVAYTAAMSGRRDVAERWMDWLNTHRTTWGSLPEKVLADGALAGPAPLAWTAALVILTAAALDT